MDDLTAKIFCNVNLLAVFCQDPSGLFLDEVRFECFLNLWYLISVSVQDVWISVIPGAVKTGVQCSGFMQEKIFKS